MARAIISGIWKVSYCRIIRTDFSFNRSVERRTCEMEYEGRLEVDRHRGKVVG
jgi:hypothetical protein